MGPTQELRSPRVSLRLADPRTTCAVELQWATANVARNSRFGDRSVEGNQFLTSYFISNPREDLTVCSTSDLA